MADPYAPVAKAYREHLGNELAAKPLDRAFLDAFAERCAGGPIVEVGCGPGQVAAYLASRGASISGLDLSPAMIEEARLAHPTIPFVVGDMLSLPYAGGSLRGVVAFYAIVHFATKDLARPLAELACVLAPGGLVAVAFHLGDETVHVDSMWDCATSLDFIFHPPLDVISQLIAAGLTLEARLDRQPYPDAEHATQRCYLLARR